MDIRIAIVDDFPESISQISRITEDFIQKSGIGYLIRAYESPAELLFDLDQGKYYDLYLLDVQMPGTNGIEVAREIRGKYFDPDIIYVTDYIEYSPQAFEVNAFRYIPKIKLREKLPEALEVMLLKLKDRKCSSYIIRHYLDVIILQCRDIYYLKKEGKYVEFCCGQGTERERTTLKAVLSKLPPEEFVEIGRGHAVNICHVMCLRQREIHLRNGEILPVSSSHLRLIQERIEAYCRSSGK